MSTSIYPSRWTVEHPERLQVYTAGTPNGLKATIALEEMGLPYELHRVDLGGDQHDPEYVKLNPNSKIPVVVDPDGPGGEPLPIMESGAILIHLAKKSGRFLSTDPRRESETLQWLFFQVGHVGPMFGQFGHFYKFARGKTDSYGEQRYGNEARRLLGLLDRHLADREYLIGDFSIADIATVPWMNALDFYEAKETLGFDQYKNVNAWVDRFIARPGVQRGIDVVKKD